MAVGRHFVVFVRRYDTCVDVVDVGEQLMAFVRAQRSGQTEYVGLVSLEECQIRDEIGREVFGRDLEAFF